MVRRAPDRDLFATVVLKTGVTRRVTSLPDLYDTPA